MKSQLKLRVLVSLLLGVFCVCGAQSVLAQSAAAAGPAQGSGRFKIDVQVRDKKGSAITGLKPGDFTLLIDKQPVKMDELRVVENTVVTSYDLTNPGAAAKTSMEPVQVVLVLDAVNDWLQEVNLIREQLKRYFSMNGGHLPAPTQLVLYKSSGMQLGPVTMDGNVLEAMLEKESPMLRTQRSSQGSDGERERFETSLKSFTQLAQYLSKTPGRKQIIWLGLGWPIVQIANMQFNAQFLDQAYASETAMLNQLRENRLTVYNVRMEADSRLNSRFYEEFLKPVQRKKDADSASLAVQVFSVWSGGRVTDPSNDMASSISICAEEAASYYSVSFAPVVSGKALTYHSIEVKVARPDAKARTVVGYYE